MKANKVLSTVSDRAGISKAAIGRAVGVTAQAVGKAFRADGVGLEQAARYLAAMGWTLYAVPSALHVDAISDDAIKIEPESRAQSDAAETTATA